MIVEALINLRKSASVKGYWDGDILTVQPANFHWGKGDLKGRIVVTIDMPDFPCGNEFMVTKKCQDCEHQGIAWESDTFDVGDTAPPKITCPKERYTAPDVVFTFSVSDKGLPYITEDLSTKRRAYIDISSVLSDESLEAYLNETDQTDDQLASKLELARKPSNIVAVDKIVEKI